MPTTRTVTIKPRTPGYKPRNGASRGRRNRRTKVGIVTKFNNFLNNLSGLQFGILLIIFVGLSITGFNYVSGLEVPSINIINKPIGDDDSDCTDKLNPLCWTDSLFPKLKETDQYTNALLIGLDTRGSDSGLMNTDTLLLASYDHRTGKTLLVSFPRDLYVPYHIGESGPYKTKINSIYAIAENSGKDGMDVLKQNMEDWFDLEIHYTGKVYFDTVIDLVDSMGGIDIELEENYTDIYPSVELPPDLLANCKVATDMSKYCVFSFEKGINHFDGQMALIYARMRQYTSDFDRARRQQEVIDAIKTKGVSKEGSLIDKAKFGWEIYQSLLDDDKIESNADYSDMLGGLFLLDKADLDPVKIVLNPSFGNGGFFIETSIPLPGYVPEDKESTATVEEAPITETEEGKEEVIVPEIPTMYVIMLRNNSFDGILNEINRIRKYTDLYSEKAAISFVDSFEGSLDVDTNLKKLKSQNLFFGKTNYLASEERYEDYKYNIFVFNQDSLSTAEFLQNTFGDESKLYKIYEAGSEQQTGNEDIKVVVANEYLSAP